MNADLSQAPEIARLAAPASVALPPQVRTASAARPQRVRSADRGSCTTESAPLRAGRVRLHGRPAAHRVRGAGHGYAVTLHWAAATAPFGKLIQKSLFRTCSGVCQEVPIPLREYDGIIQSADAE